MIVEASAEALGAQASLLKAAGLPLPAMARQTLGLQVPTPCPLPMPQTAKNNRLEEVIVIATSNHPLKLIPHKPRTHLRQTLPKILVIQIEIPSPAITPIPAPCPMATARQDTTIRPVEVVVLGACPSAAAQVPAQVQRRMTALPPRSRLHDLRTILRCHPWLLAQVLASTPSRPLPVFITTFPLPTCPMVALRQSRASPIMLPSTQEA